MRIAGVVISLFTLTATAILVWMFYAVTFGEPNFVHMFESEPPEGWAYWQRKAFWADLWPFLGLSSIAVATGAMPLISVLYAKPRSFRRSMGIAICSGLLGLPVGLMTFLSFARMNFHLLFWAPPILLVGCLFAALYTIAALSKHQAEQGVDRKPDHVPS